MAINVGFPDHEAAVHVDNVSPGPTVEHPTLDEILEAWSEHHTGGVASGPVQRPAAVVTSPDGLIQSAAESLEVREAASSGWIAPEEPLSATGHLRSWLGKIKAMLLAAYDWLSGPPMIERDRHQRVLAEVEAELRAWRLR